MIQEQPQPDSLYQNYSRDLYKITGDEQTDSILDMFGTNPYANSSSSVSLPADIVGSGIDPATTNQTGTTQSQISAGTTKSLVPGDDIQAAITAVSRAGGGTVYLAPGLYTVLTSLTLYDGIALVGAGLAQSIIDFANNNAAVTVTGASNDNVTAFAIRDLGIIRSGAAAALDIDYGANFEIDNIQIINDTGTGYGIRIQRSKIYRLTNSYIFFTGSDALHIVCDSNQPFALAYFYNNFLAPDAGHCFYITTSTDLLAAINVIGCNATFNANSPSATYDGFKIDGAGHTLPLSLIGCFAIENLHGYNIIADGVSVISCSGDGNTTDFAVSGNNDKFIANTASSGATDFANTGTSVYQEANSWQTSVERVVTLRVVAEGSGLSTGDGQAYFVVPPEMDGMNLVSVGAHVFTVATVGTPTFQIANATAGVDMLSTKITVDTNEKDSKTAATPAVIDTTHDDVATGDEIRIDIDVAGTSTKGLAVRLGFSH